MRGNDPRRVDQLGSGERVLVCGAGPAGLTAAYALAKQGHSAIVLECDDTVGGISRTARYKEYRFDIGGHRFFTKYRPVEAIWEEVLGDQFIEVPRLSRIHYDGKYFDYPIRPLNALSGLGVTNAVRIVLSYLTARVRPHPTEETFDQWVTNRFGRRLYEIFFKTYTEKVWGIPCAEIRAEWAAQRIQGLSLGRAILAAASLTRRAPDIKTLINSFRYPRLGPGQMWELCRDRLAAMGTPVHLRHRVTNLELCDGRIRAVRVATPLGELRYEVDHVISTLPVGNLVDAIDPVAPSAIRQAAAGLRYRDFLVVALVLDRPDLFPDNWIYIHTPGVRVGRVQNFNNWSVDMVPNPGQTCLGLEYFCFEGDGLWSMDDAALIELATRELDALNLASGARVLDGSVVRMQKAYPIYDADYRRHLETIRSFIDVIPNLHTVGRNGMHKYNNQDHSMLTALFAVENMLGAAHDIWGVNTDFDYHEVQRVDIPEQERAMVVA